jgi:hypothetical protein
MTVGEKMKDNLTGEVFEVKIIVKERKLLRDETDHRQCLTGLNSPKLLYEKSPVGFHNAEFRHAGDITNFVMRNIFPGGTL